MVVFRNNFATIILMVIFFYSRELARVCVNIILFLQFHHWVSKEWLGENVGNQVDDEYSCRLLGKIRSEERVEQIKDALDLQRIDGQLPKKVSVSLNAAITKNSRVHRVEQNSVCKAVDGSLFIMEHFVQCADQFLAFCKRLSVIANDRFTEVGLTSETGYLKLKNFSRPIAYFKTSASTYVLLNDGVVRHQALGSVMRVRI